MANRLADGFAPDFKFDRPLYASKDFTFYLSGGEGRKLPIASRHFTCNGSIEISRNDLYLRGRAIVCRCFQKQLLSVTVRHDGLKSKAGSAKVSQDAYWEDAARIQQARDALMGSEWNAADSAEFPLGLRDICDELYKLLNSRGGRLQGLLLVTGATKSAKSEVARGLVHRYLTDLVGSKDLPSRRPHLVTFEDPIEKRFQDPPLNGTCLLVDYSPRELGRDVASLEDAVSDALRQTPAAFYIGEIRSDGDWKDVLHLAGTGHLVVATTHAGSLVEAMQRIFTALQADSPAKRGIFANRLLGVIHQRAYSIISNEKNEQKEAVLPTLWRHTPLGVAALVSDGLSSILPHVPAPWFEDRTSSFGRSWFVNRFATRSPTFRAFKESAAEGALCDDLAGS